MTVSVCTIARGRAAHLANMLGGLAQQDTPPSEVVIAHMQPAPYAGLPDCPFPVRQVAVPGERLPLAAARNAAARAARGALLVFLDVDCIPLPDLLRGYRDAARPGRCLMGETRYLARGDLDPQAPLAPTDLWQCAVQHPARQFGAEARRLAETTEFWSLSFALDAQTFRDTGGFDERFDGYGGEDTDFALRLQHSGTELHWTPAARAVHQWHPVQIPPCHHLQDIVRNANRFHDKHGQWCMGYWLDQFEAQGLIRRPADGPIEILRLPSADERQAATQGGTVRFS